MQKEGKGSSKRFFIQSEYSGLTFSFFSGSPWVCTIACKKKRKRNCWCFCPSQTRFVIVLNDNCTIISTQIGQQVALVDHVHWRGWTTLLVRVTLDCKLVHYTTIGLLMPNINQANCTSQ